MSQVAPLLYYYLTVHIGFTYLIANLSSLVHLEFLHYSNNRSVLDLSKCHSLTHLSLECLVAPNGFPPYLQYLSYKGPNSPITFPPLLTHLELRSFNQPLNNLPLSLTYLQLGPCFAKSLDHLPPLTHLILHKDCVSNLPVNQLPMSLTHLTFGADFAQEVDHLPPLSHSPLFWRIFQEKCRPPPSLSHPPLFWALFQPTLTPPPQPNPPDPPRIFQTGIKSHPPFTLPHYNLLYVIR
jgi:hypothetical protein